MEFIYTGEDAYRDPSDPYLPDADLVEALNVAAALERPLLLRGEPGCGKTRLAKAVAFELSLKHAEEGATDRSVLVRELQETPPEEWPVPYWEWPVKSTSQARDGLYVYDTVARLRDAQLASTDLVDKEDLARFDDPETYIRWGQLGLAFQSDRRSVVLIDEIDKADMDFPNDLLQELDQQRFYVTETSPQREVRATHRPLILITSNNEKPLPDAFLRRCLFFFIDFPEGPHLRQIVSLHLSNYLARELTAGDGVLIREAVDRFVGLRKEMEPEKQHYGKLVSTSELIDWVKILERNGTANVPLTGELLYPSVLLKSREDQLRYGGNG